MPISKSVEQRKREKKKDKNLEKYWIQAEAHRNKTKHEEIRRSRDKAGLGRKKKPEDTVLIVSVKKW